MSALDGPEDRPKSLKDVAIRIQLETLNALAEYGTLVLFSAATVLVEAMRRYWNLPPAGNAAVVTAEIASAITMVVPKAIRVFGEIVQLLAIVLHDSVYALRHGSKRPRVTAREDQ